MLTCLNGNISLRDWHKFDASYGHRKDHFNYLQDGFWVKIPQHFNSAIFVFNGNFQIKYSVCSENWISTAC